MKDDRVYLGHILEAIYDIEQYAGAGRQAFMTDKMRQDALIRKLEVRLIVCHPASHWHVERACVTTRDLLSSVFDPMVDCISIPI